MVQEIRTEYFVEIPFQGRTIPLGDESVAIEMVKNQYPNGRVVRRIIRTEVIEDIVYPLGLPKWKYGEEYSV